MMRRLQVTFADQLGAAKHNEGEVNSKNEAKKLAFYLFWNIKPYFDRYANLHALLIKASPSCAPSCLNCL